MTPLLDFTDKPNQKAFFLCKDRNVAFFGGYGNGKTYAGVAKIWLLLETIPENVALIGRKTYPALNSTTRESFLRIAAARNGGSLEKGQLIHSFNKSENVLTLNNGSVCYFRTLDSTEKLRSLNLGAALVDQGEEVAEEIYLELNGRIRKWSTEAIKAWRDKWAEKLQAQMGWVPEPRNQVVVVGNPAPNWAKDTFKLQKKGRVSYFEASTAENTKYLPEGYIEDLRNQYPEEWVKRFIDGDWDTMGGAVFKTFDIKNVHGIEPMDLPAHWVRFAGHDHGFTNATAVIPAAVDEEGNIIIPGEYYASGRLVSENAAEIKQMLSLYLCPTGHDGSFLTHMDPSTHQHNGVGSESIWDTYLKNGIYGLDANNDKEAGLLLMQELFKPRDDRKFPAWHPKAGQFGSPRIFIVAKRCPNLVNELQLYEWEESRLGQNKSEVARKENDHAIDALRYCSMAIRDAKAIPLSVPIQDHERQRNMERERIEWAFSLDEDPESFDPRPAVK